MPGVPGKNHRRAVAAFGKIGYRVLRESGHIILLLESSSRVLIPDWEESLPAEAQTSLASS